MENGFGRNKIIASLILAGGLVLSGFCIGGGVGEGLKHIHPPHVVSVKGLSERLAKADLAMWSLQFSATGNDINALQPKMENDVKSVVDFLKSQGLGENEVTADSIKAVDLLAREYRSENVQNNRFIFTATVRVRSDKVELVQAISQKTGTLIKSGVIFSNENNGNSGPQFLFTKINDIKLDMLAEATKNARAAAQQFARDSGENLGVIVEANQGVFSILPADGSSVGDNYSEQMAERSQIMKKVRVVSTVKYELSN